MKLAPRIERAAAFSAAVIAKKIVNGYTQNKYKSWDELAKGLSITLPAATTSLPFTYVNVSLLSRYWQTSWKERIQEEFSSDDNKLLIDKNVETFGEITLKPEQQATYLSILEKLKDRQENAVLCDGDVGLGKTPITCAVLHSLIFKCGFLDKLENKYLIHPILIICPDIIRKDWVNTLKRMGLEDYYLRGKIHIISDTDFQGQKGEKFCTEEIDPWDETNVTYKWNKHLSPALVIIDEIQRFRNPLTKRTLCVESLLDKNNVFPTPQFICLSATPFEKVNDSRLFVLLCEKTFLGINVKAETFGIFSRTVTPNPETPSKESLKNLRKVLRDNIVSIPYVKPKHRPYYTFELTDFRNEHDRKIYEKAMETYLRSCALTGKNTDNAQMMRMVALGIFKKTVEPLRVHRFTEIAAHNYFSRQKSTAIFCAYTQTIADVVFDLVENKKIPRNKISIIWGGRKRVKIEDLLSKEEFQELMDNPELFMSRIAGNPKMAKKITDSLEFFQEGIARDETEIEQKQRHEKLELYGLTGIQSKKKRREEVDKYQSGETEIIVMTIQSGGVGLTLDRSQEHILPREGLVTMIYKGDHFLQAFGRLCRRMSISDAHYKIFAMKDTIESDHVLPILDGKLKATASFTNRLFEICDLYELYNKAKLTMPERTVEIAKKEAEEFDLEGIEKELSIDNADTIDDNEENELELTGK